MYMQRLRTDETVGFNYDYMGAAEYEFGATKNGRMAIAQAYIDGTIKAKLVKVREDNGPEHEMIILAPEKFLADCDDVFHFTRLKERMRLDDPRIIAWMNVKWDRVDIPLMLVRTDVPTWRVDKFFKDPIDYLRAGGKES